MNTKIMEGLVGATTNMRQTNTTMRVFRDARRRGDLDVMERAMEYTGDYTQKAGEYQEKAQEGMEEEAQEVREKMMAQMAEAIQNRKEEQKEQDEKLAEAKEKKQQADTLEVSQEGQALLLDNLGMPKGQTQPGTGADSGTGGGSGGPDGSAREPVTYNGAGIAAPMGQPAGYTVSV